jgi:choice-of-anchor C domain-containing protein
MEFWRKGAGRFTRAIAILAWSVLLFTGARAEANMLVNGSFEVGPALGGAVLVDLAGGSTAITGWTVGGNFVDYCGPAVWNISNGIRNVDLDGNHNYSDNGSISQSFATTIGQQYNVTFDLSGNPVYYPLIKKLLVTAGASSQVFSFDIGAIVPAVLPVTLNYVSETFNFIATESLTTLSFTSLTYETGITGYGPVIDNVVVEGNNTPVPEPATFFLLGIGLAAAGIFQRRMRV